MWHVVKHICGLYSLNYYIMVDYRQKPFVSIWKFYAWYGQLNPQIFYCNYYTVLSSAVDQYQLCSIISCGPIPTVLCHQLRTNTNCAQSLAADQYQLRSVISWFVIPLISLHVRWRSTSKLAKYFDCGIFLQSTWGLSSL